MRLSLVGDIMCSKEHLASARVGSGFDFDSTFKNFDKQALGIDYLVGNLESPVAGAEAGLVDHKWSFNAPVEFAEALKRAGFDLVSLANNHCLDRGLAGARTTVDNLDRIGLAHTGINLTQTSPKFVIKELQGIRVGFLSYTYGTNRQVNKHTLRAKDRHLVNLFHYQELTLRRWQLVQRVFYKIRHKIFALSSPLRLRAMLKEVKCCRQAGAEFVVICLHIGGQYNAAPETYTTWVVNKLSEAGADAVVACHEHVVHGIKLKDQQIQAMSLGNFLYHPQSESLPAWAVDQLRAHYSIMLHLDLIKHNEQVKLTQASFTVFKNCLINNQPQVVTVSDLAKSTELTSPDQLQSDMQYIVNKALSRAMETPVAIAKEYRIHG